MDDGRKADIHQRITKNLPDFMAQVSKNEKKCVENYWEHGWHFRITYEIIPEPFTMFNEQYDLIKTVC